MYEVQLLDEDRLLEVFNKLQFEWQEQFFRRFYLTITRVNCIFELKYKTFYRNGTWRTGIRLATFWNLSIRAKFYSTYQFLSFIHSNIGTITHT